MSSLSLKLVHQEPVLGVPEKSFPLTAQFSQKSCAHILHLIPARYWRHTVRIGLQSIVAVNEISDGCPSCSDKLVPGESL